MIRLLDRFVASIKLPIYGGSSDRLDEYHQLYHLASDISLKCFYWVVVEEFGEHYLNRCPTTDEMQRSVNIIKVRGFPVFVRWDWKQYFWKNCLKDLVR